MLVTTVVNRSIIYQRTSGHLFNAFNQWITFLWVSYSFMISLRLIVISIDFYILTCSYSWKPVLDRSASPRTKGFQSDDVEVYWTAFLRSCVILSPATTFVVWSSSVDFPTTTHLGCRVVIFTCAWDHCSKEKRFRLERVYLH